ncbi:PEP-CTERM sorting domain-containing protein [Roseateles violae]|uniref:PEP-CTERM sorting domain-containing protein n=1 Tax=Roseateles violae TaxID=3058042 RepID=A0ABT8DVG3_9BURK|nr:PEP-CTERM sorting domain-containing protein [Pelomonas sp. PFR6]MDN3922295.1 PEP-CTERM sorting domain-containing protein [Pelomonas sp. PFR6]
MKAIKSIPAITMLVAAVSSFADPLLLDFEDVTANTGYMAVGELYAAKGAHFSEGVFLAGSEKVFGEDIGLGNFYGPGGTTANRGAVNLNTSRNTNGVANLFTITTDHQFNGVFSLIYGGESTVTITAHLVNGSAVSSATGPATALCDASAFVCNWTSLSLDLNGVAASSFDISGTSGKLWFDNISFADAAGNGGGNVPEPTGMALSLAALGALAWSRKRNQ